MSHSPANFPFTARVERIIFVPTSKGNDQPDLHSNRFPYKNNLLIARIRTSRARFEESRCYMG